jgi:hypothetical protein
MKAEGTGNSRRRRYSPTRKLFFGFVKHYPDTGIHVSGRSLRRQPTFSLDSLERGARPGGHLRAYAGVLPVKVPRDCQASERCVIGKKCLVCLIRLPRLIPPCYA